MFFCRGHVLWPLFREHRWRISTVTANRPRALFVRMGWRLRTQTYIICTQPFLPDAGMHILHKGYFIRNVMTSSLFFSLPQYIITENRYREVLLHITPLWLKLQTMTAWWSLSLQVKHCFLVLFFPPCVFVTAGAAEWLCRGLGYVFGCVCGGAGGLVLCILCVMVSCCGMAAV